MSHLSAFTFHQALLGLSRARVQVSSNWVCMKNIYSHSTSLSFQNLLVKSLVCLHSPQSGTQPWTIKRASFTHLFPFKFATVRIKKQTNKQKKNYGISPCSQFCSDPSSCKADYFMFVASYQALLPPPLSRPWD